MTVRDLLERIDSRELSEWMAYYTLEPFGQDRGDLGPAIVAATIANIHRKADCQPYELREFLPRFDTVKESKKNWKELMAITEMLGELYGSQGLRGQS